MPASMEILKCFIQLLFENNNIRLYICFKMLFMVFSQIYEKVIQFYLDDFFAGYCQ